MPRRRRRTRYATDQDMALLVAGALAGAGAGVWLARRFGGFLGFVREVRGWLRDIEAVLPGGFSERDDEWEEKLADIRTAHGHWDEEEGDAGESAGDVAESRESAAPSEADRALEQSVLAAFEGDDVMKRRPVAIAAMGNGVIELTGLVRSSEEASRAAAIARAVPGVGVVLDRMGVRGGGHVDTASAPRD